MIDRKALWVSLAATLVMITAGIWRFSLLSDWHHMRIGAPSDHHIVNGLMLFLEPAGLLLATAVLLARKWFTCGPQDAITSWQRWSGTMLILCAGLTLLAQAIVIAHSLDYGADLDWLTIARALMVLSGIVMIVTGNALPKLPWLSTRLRWFQLDPWQQNRHRRLQGRLMVALGLLLAAGGPLLLGSQPAWFAPICLSLCLGLVAVSIAYRIKLRREPSPQ